MKINFSEEQLAACFDRMNKLYSEASQALQSNNTDKRLDVGVIDLIVFYEHSRLWAESLEECRAFIRNLEKNLEVHQDNVEHIMAGREVVGDIPNSLSKSSGQNRTSGDT